MHQSLGLAGAAIVASAAALLPQSALAHPVGAHSAGSHGVGASAHPSRGHRSTPVPDPNACSPRVAAVGYSDALDKLQVDGAEVSGLSSLAWDARQRAWVSALDNNGQTTPEYLWSFRDLSDPRVLHAPLVLKKADGTPYDGGPAATDPNAADDEGLAVLPNGDYLVSSETEPSIRVFGRDGVQRAELPVPARFAVTGTTTAGEATSNATLEGLTITPDGRTIVASMEGALSGDVSASGDATAHRLLVYRLGRHGHWTLAKQVEYRTGAGMRIPEIAAYSNNALVVEEATWSATTGNVVRLFAVDGLRRARDVSAVTNLGEAPGRLALPKTELADLVDCPTLGASALEFQQNPLLDNYEGMAITGRERGGRYGLTLVSDDNNSALQHTRLLNLSVRLP
ncbi:esterase-like activity of phytase family protein [Nocardioides sp. BP30]|uniref:esterase-like activity of phytase family protein n=1 Tax=Nocardioides sp. BP30 TaxID=3036374 RepID=UPI0024682F08|nr:esterase-like activity of phytase family protein [Nocardioides sp. BP30]WGL53336.1 esterase-like activity of phytase family protein [Nocardioides sp. BP30]